MTQKKNLGRWSRKRTNGVLVAALLAVSGPSIRQTAPNDQTSHARASKPEKAVTAKNPGQPNAKLLAPLPFRAGEALNYRLTWSVFLNAAAVQLCVVEWRDLFGTPTWHFRATAHTQVPLRSLAEIDDQFDSYAETASLESRQYETYLDELGEKENTILRLVSMNVPRKNGAPVVLVKPYTRDPLAALYLLRTVDWQRTLEFHSPVFDGEDLYEMSARVESAMESISVTGRSENATRVSVHLLRAGQQSRTKCSIWFSQDEARIPLIIEADVPYGRVRAELVSKVE
jgi:hypothetical protein